MRVRDVITAVREKTNDPNVEFWSDVEITRWITHHNRYLYRHRADAENSHGFTSLRFDTAAADFHDRVRRLKDDVWRYTVPSWWYRILGIREITDKFAGQRGRLVPRISYPRSAGKGWFVSGDRSFDLNGFKNPVDLEFECHKLPAPLHYGTIDSEPPSREQFRFASAPTAIGIDGETLEPFMLDWEVDSYVGAEIELITGSTETSNRRGAVHQITSQVQFYDASLATPAWVVECTVFPKFPTKPQVGDTYEMHLPVDESSFEFVTARVARSLFHKTRHTEGIRMLESVIAGGLQTFLSSLRPRQQQSPDLMGSPDQEGRFDENKDWSVEFLG